MTNEVQETINELKIILFDCQNPIDITLKNGILISFETGDGGFIVWREGTDDVFFNSMDAFLDNYYIDGIPFRELIDQIDSIE